MEHASQANNHKYTSKYCKRFENSAQLLVAACFWPSNHEHAGHDNCHQYTSYHSRELMTCAPGCWQLHAFGLQMMGDLGCELVVLVAGVDVR
eukprot:scaffold6959_cov21-Tisochrysis_lutea.AAC.1